MKRDIVARIIIAVMALVIGGVMGYVFFGGSGGDDAKQSAEAEKETVWTCSMHPQIRKSEPGQCPICGMDLIPLEDSGPQEFGTFTMSKEAAALANIQVADVEFSLPQKELILQGKVKVDETRLALVTSRFAGRIEKLYVNATGQYVGRGQTLASIYSPELISAQRELFEATTLKDVSPELYKAARMKLKLWGLTENQINAIEQKGEPLETVSIVSPQSGIVLERKATLGEYVKEGTVMFKVADLTRVWVEFDAYEQDLPWLDVGDPVEFTISAVPGMTFNEEISFIDPVVDPQTRTTKVRVALQNTNDKLKPSMYATANIEAKLPIEEAQLTIPKSAVLWTGKRSIVYVYQSKDGDPSFSFREVDLGPDLGNSYIVESGVEEGEEVVVNGAFKVDAAAQLAGQRSMMNARPVGQKKDHSKHDHANMDHSKHNHSELRVTGECGMCKSRIEKVANGFADIMMAEWNEESQMLTLHHESEDIDLEKIAKAIADAGHDNELFKAPQAAIEALPQCCKYTNE